MQIYANGYDNVNGISNVLNLAIRFSIPFYLLVSMEDVGLFKSQAISNTEAPLNLWTDLGGNIRLLYSSHWASPEQT
jgi:hypothetical protein